MCIRDSATDTKKNASKGGVQSLFHVFHVFKINNKYADTNIGSYKSIHGLFSALLRQNNGIREKSR